MQLRMYGWGRERGDGRVDVASSVRWARWTWSSFEDGGKNKGLLEGFGRPDLLPVTVEFEEGSAEEMTI